MHHFAMLTSREQLVETVLNMVSELKGMLNLDHPWSTWTRMRIIDLDRWVFRAHCLFI